MEEEAAAAEAEAVAAAIRTKGMAAVTGTGGVETMMVAVEVAVVMMSTTAETTEAMDHRRAVVLRHGRQIQNWTGTGTGTEMVAGMGLRIGLTEEEREAVLSQSLRTEPQVGMVEVLWSAAARWGICSHLGRVRALTMGRHRQ